MSTSLRHSIRVLLILLLGLLTHTAQAQLYHTYIANNTENELCTVQPLKTQEFFSISSGRSREDCMINDVRVWFSLSIKDRKIEAGFSANTVTLPPSSTPKIRRVALSTSNGKMEISIKVSGDSVTFGITPIPHHPATPEANKLSILTYNLWGTSIYGAKKVSTRFTEMPKFFHNYDVLALEEQFDVKPSKALHNTLKREYPYQTQKLKKLCKLLQAGIYILSRYPIIKQASMVYHSCNGLQCFTSKGVIYTEINKKGQKYHIFDTHTQSGHSAKDIHTRMAQVRALAKFIKAQNIPKDEPIIIAGDFNIDMLNQKANYNTMLDDLNATHPDSTGYSLTYDHSVNKWSDDEYAYFDYLMYDNDHLLPIASKLRVIAPRSTVPELWDHWDLSDHFAVEGQFEYATPSAN